MDTEQEYSGLYVEQEHRIPRLRNIEYSEDNLRGCN